MHPILFSIGPLDIPAYGAFLVFAFLVSSTLMKKEAKRMGLDPIKTWDTAIMGLLFGLIGAKLLLILVDLPDYLANPREILGTLRSAGVIYGGLIGGALGVIFYIKKHKLPMLQTLDCMVPFAALGIGLGRISCFMAGCCYGKPYEGFMALHFPEHQYCDAPANIGLFPIQPLALLNGILLFLVLVALLRRRQFEGQVVAAFMFLYGLTRGLLEIFRGDTVRGLWLNDLLSTSQIIAILAMITSMVLYLQFKKGAQK